MKTIFALPGFHRYDRGAEVALLSVARELALDGEEVTVCGSGPPREAAAYRYICIPSVRRETCEALPNFPPFRSETAWEDATFSINLLRKVELREYDASVTCSFPFSHWALRRYGKRGPAHIFVTQNGDWPAFSNGSEFATFSCEGLVCTNPDYMARNEARWNCSLIPNGVDLKKFKPGPAAREKFGLRADRPVVLMVSALIESKRVLDGIRAVSEIDDATLVVAGDGPLREEVAALSEKLLPGRFLRISLSAEQMPELYRCADVFLHLSLLESFGNVFLEAWASGLPIVGHESERLRWILGSRHHLCDTTEPNELRGALKAALAAGPRPPSDGVERYSWAAIGSEYRGFIARTVARR